MSSQGSPQRGSVAGASRARAVEVEFVDGVTVCRVRSPLLEDAAPLASLLDQVMEAGKRRIVVDADAPPMLSAQAIGVLCGYVEAARRHGGDVKVVCANAVRRRMFECCGLTRMADVTATVEEAVGLFHDGVQGVERRLLWMATEGGAPDG